MTPATYPRRRLRGRSLTLLLGGMLALALASLPVAPGDAETGRGTFAYLQSADRGFSYQLKLSDTHGGNRSQVGSRRAVGRPAFSPDGRRLAFSGPLTDDSDGRYAIFVVNRNGSGLRRLTKPRFADFDPAWSPDGRRIAFSRDHRGNSNRSTCCAIWTMRSDGSGERAVPNTTGGVEPTWSPDSRRLAYARPGGIRVIGLDGRGGRWLAEGRVTEPAWSPDGRHIAYVRTPTATRGRIEVKPNSGGTARERFSGAALTESPAWGADSRTLYFVAFHGNGDDGRRDSTVWRSSGPGGPNARLFSFARKLFGLAYAPGGPQDRDTAVTGDWNGNSTDRAGVVRQDGDELRWLLTDRIIDPKAGTQLHFGSARRFDVAVTGDWDASGNDTPGVVRPAGDRLEWRLTNRLSNPTASIVFRFGSAHGFDVPVAGDWNGSGNDTAGLVRASDGSLRWLLTNRLSNPKATIVFRYGSLERFDRPLTGDFDGDDRDTVGLARPSGATYEWRLSNRPDSGRRATVFRFGSLSRHEVPVIGDWNGDGIDTAGVVGPVGDELRWRVTDDPRGPGEIRTFRFGRS